MDKTTKKDFWQNHIKKWSESGLSQIDYCTHCKIPLSNFGYWKRKLQKADNCKPIFYPLTVSPKESGDKEKTETGLILLLKDGRFKIEIQNDFSSSSLSKIVTTLEQL